MLKSDFEGILRLIHLQPPGNDRFFICRNWGDKLNLNPFVLRFTGEEGKKWLVLTLIMVAVAVVVIAALVTLHVVNVR